MRISDWSSDVCSSDLDTADVYGNGANEELVSKVLVENRDKIFIATKFGFRVRNNPGDASGGGESYIDGSPTYIEQEVERSLRSEARRVGKERASTCRSRLPP